MRGRYRNATFSGMSLLAGKESQARKYLADLTDADLDAVIQLLDETFVQEGWTDAGIMGIWGKEERLFRRSQPHAAARMSG